MEAEILVKKAKRGDKDALVKLIMVQQKEYYRLAYVYMKNKEDALDALEDMIVIVYENIYRLKKEDAFYSWSKTILVNCCKNMLRKRRKIVSLDRVEEEGYEGGFGQKDNQVVVEAYLSQLPIKHQEVLRLRYFLQLDYETIAGLLGVPLGTVKSRISIGIKKLKEKMRGDGDE